MVTSTVNPHIDEQQTLTKLSALKTDLSKVYQDMQNNYF